MIARLPSIPGLYLAKGPDSKDWGSSTEVKRRHFALEGQKLKLFGRRGKTYKGAINLLAVEALRPTTDATAPLGSLELQVRSSRSHGSTICILAPDHSVDDLFMALGNAVPSHATSDDLWRLRMGSRPAANAGSAHEYRIGKTLGSGTFGKVKLAQRVSDGSLFAIKCLSRSRIVMAVQSGRLAKEIKLLKLLNHPNVIRLHEVLHTQAEILMVMECAAPLSLSASPGRPHNPPRNTPTRVAARARVVRYIDGGDLLDVLNTQPRFKEEQVRHLFGQIVCGVAFCHSLGVAHRDLKPENILIQRRQNAPALIKVADFGLSTLTQANEMLSTACGSPHYVAPEILNFDGHSKYNGREADVWSLGVILHVMLCYKLPFEAESTQLLYKKIRQGLLSLPSHILPAARSLLHGMLEVAPEKRLTLPQVARHEWLQLEMEQPRLSPAVDAVVDTSLDGGAGSSLLSHPKVYRPAVDATEPCDVQVQVRRAFTFDVLPRTSSETDLLGGSTSKRLQRSPRPSPPWSPSPRSPPTEPQGQAHDSPTSPPPMPAGTMGERPPMGDKPVLRGLPESPE